MGVQNSFVKTSENISIVIPNEFMKMLEKAWNIKENEYFYEWKWDKKVIYKYKLEWKMACI